MAQAEKKGTPPIRIEGEEYSHDVDMIILCLVNGFSLNLSLSIIGNLWGFCWVYFTFYQSRAAQVNCCALKSKHDWTQYVACFFSFYYSCFITGIVCFMGGANSMFPLCLCVPLLFCRTWLCLVNISFVYNVYFVAFGSVYRTGSESNNRAGQCYSMTLWA